jgi:hypothetical protein
VRSTSFGFNAADQNLAAICLRERKCANPEIREMAERPVVTGREARAASKEGVVRYVLLASLVLVVVLFIVAYEIFS